MPHEYLRKSVTMLQGTGAREARPEKKPHADDGMERSESFKITELDKSVERLSILARPGWN